MTVFVFLLIQKKPIFLNCQRKWVVKKSILFIMIEKE